MQTRTGKITLKHNGVEVEPHGLGGNVVTLPCKRGQMLVQFELVRAGDSAEAALIIGENISPDNARLSKQVACGTAVEWKLDIVPFCIVTVEWAIPGEHLRSITILCPEAN